MGLFSDAPLAGGIVPPLACSSCSSSSFPVPPGHSWPGGAEGDRCTRYLLLSPLTSPPSALLPLHFSTFLEKKPPLSPSRRTSCHFLPAYLSAEPALFLLLPPSPHLSFCCPQISLFHCPPTRYTRHIDSVLWCFTLPTTQTPTHAGKPIG